MSSHPTQVPSSQNNPALQSDGVSQAAPSVVVLPAPDEEPVESSTEVGSVSVDPSLVVSAVVAPVVREVPPAVPASVPEPPAYSVPAAAEGDSDGEKQALSATRELSAARPREGGSRRILRWS